MRRAIPVLLSFALVASGCAGGADRPEFQGTEEAVAQAVEDLGAALRTQEGAEEVCAEALTPELAERLDGGGSTCRQEIAYAIADADLVALTVTDVAVSGDSARAVTESASGDTEVTATFALERVEGSWRVAGIEPAG